MKNFTSTLPDTPTKRRESEIIMQRIKSCSKTRKNLIQHGIVYSEENEKQNKLNASIVENLSSNLNSLKQGKGTLPEDNRKAYKSGITLATKTANRGNVSRVCKQLKVGRKSVGKENIIKARKKRKDTIPHEHVKIAKDYWKNKSRPTGDKNDIKRQRIGLKMYKEHAKHVLEKTQRETFLDFRKDHPEIKMSETFFRKCKPYFVVAACRRDRITCLCRKHQELRMVFMSCAKFRAQCQSAGTIDKNSFPAFESCSQVVNTTLCPKEDTYHKISCLTRNCDTCGVGKLKLSDTELDKSDSAPTIKWQKYGYIDAGIKEDGSKIRKISLINMETKPGELFEYFKELLGSYPHHDFMAKWQRDQYDILKQSLPFGCVLCVHDYSENYQCTHQNEIQSLYFAKAEASLHVTVLFRHSEAEYDGEASTPENPIIVKEHIFTILDDKTHDHYAVHEIKKHIDDYLKNTVKTNVTRMHEFTDGCSAQYKSCHCMGDVSMSQSDYGYDTNREYFETAHAKGEQDSGGAHVKQKCAMAVIRQEATIGCARDMYEYLSQNFTQPMRSDSEVKRRVFFYIEGNIPRKGREFQPVPENRQIHSIVSNGDGKLLIRKRSCYCDNCLTQNYEHCLNKNIVDKFTEHEMSLKSQPSERVTRSDDQAEDSEQIAGLTELVQKGSVVAIAAENPTYDYYLMKVTSDGAERLTENTTDSYGNCFLRNTVVFKGHFFEAENKLDRVYKLDTKHQAIVYVETVRYIANEMEPIKKGRKISFHIPLDLHEDIMAAM